MTNGPVRRRRSLQVVDVALTVAAVLFAIGTVIAVAMTPATLGSGDIGLDATVVPRLENDLRRSLAEEVPLRIERADVHVNVHIPRDDRDSRQVVAFGFLAVIALWWVGLLALRSVVRSARDGKPFDERNANRLRRLAGVIILTPLLVGLLNRLLESTFDSELVTPGLARIDTVALVLIGVGVLALAEVFREGTALRDLEASTI